MNTELFTGKAEAYAKARPGYPDAAMEYIAGLAPPNAVFADIGAGTGKFTKLLAKSGNTVFAVEPNADMLEQLAVTLAPYPNATIIAAPAEATTLPGNSVDVITCAQALHWFDPDAFRTECRRIGKPGVLVIAVYNDSPSSSSDFHGKVNLSTDVFYANPTVREFPNPIFYTRDSWLQFMHTHSHSPLPNDPQYAAYIDDANAIFDRESVDGLSQRDVVTRVYWERIEK
jgi:ubiquinone/menaquinone biosynthesis C-methylase UbiE